MKKKIFYLLLGAVLPVSAQNVSIEDVAFGKFRPAYIQDMQAVPGTSTYAEVREDKVVASEFATGDSVGVLFDWGKSMGKMPLEDFSYSLSPDGSRMLIETRQNPIYRHSYTAYNYVYDRRRGWVLPLSTGGIQQAPVWSPDASKVAFAREGNLFVTRIPSMEEKQITTDGRFGSISNGIPDWVYEEEFATDRSMVFSADGSVLMWLRYDESNVRTYTLQGFNAGAENHDRLYPEEYSYKYPKAGETNSTLKVMACDLSSMKVSEVAVPQFPDGYIPRILPTPDRNKVIVCTMNRHQDTLRVWTVDPQTLVPHLLLTETDSRYIKEEALEMLTVTDTGIILASERSGRMQLYLYGLDGRLLRQVTSGDGEVTTFYGMDDTTGNVYYQRVGHTPMDREVCTALPDGSVRVLAGDSGWNSATFSGDWNHFLNTWSDANTPYVFTVRGKTGKVLSVLEDNSSLRSVLEGAEVSPKEFIKIENCEGISLNAVMIKPRNFDPAKKYPVIMWQYGGPGSQQVKNSWSIGGVGGGAMFEEHLAGQGFILFCVDGRGTGARGAEFEKSTYLALGQQESHDQVDAAQWLARQPYVDATRIGIWGWSFGGFNTLMSMSEGREVFRAGVAVAPPTDWRFYDSIYTERYMRTPQENSQGYDVSPIGRAAQLHGDLLIIHGLADDNVHPQNTFEYTQRLVELDKDYLQLVYTNRNHSIYGGNHRNHLMRQISQFFYDKMK